MMDKYLQQIKESWNSTADSEWYCLDASVIKTLTDFYTGGALITGASVLGAADDAVGLPVDSWSLANWSVEEYEALFEQIKADEVEIKRTESADPTTFGLEHVTFA